MRFALTSQILLAVAALLLVVQIESRRACDSNDTFACNDTRCIPRTWRCDGDIDCRGGEDEENCSVECSEVEFRCRGDQSAPEFKHKPGHSHCIPKKWVCDGEYDCDDRSDELNCKGQKPIQCNEDQFRCVEFEGDYVQCIPKTWQCDGQKDCFTGSDEVNCTKQCGERDFKCDNDICIFQSWKCDGEDDCGDLSDERDCDTVVKKQCTEDEGVFKCVGSDGCIPHEWVCDGEADCLDHSDEKSCDVQPHQCKRPNFEFACASGNHCINKMWKCDGEEDCPDGSDEKDCGGVTKCTDQEFTCGREGALYHSCIPLSQRCDRSEDCIDGSDEIDCHFNATVQCDEITDYQCDGDPVQCIPLKDICRTKNNVCGEQHECESDIMKCRAGTEFCDCRIGYAGKKVCHCREGFKLMGNGNTSTCVDIDECEQLGICDQHCENLVGSYKCSCIRGYKISKGSNSTIPNRCRATGGDPLVLLSNRATIRQFDLVTNTYFPLIQSPGSAVAMDFHLGNQSLIWSDISAKKIYICKIGNASDHGHLTSKHDCAGEQEVLVDDENGKIIHTPDGLAVDWIHNLLFWTDAGLDHISVLDLETGKRRVLFSDNLEEPRAIAVDPEMGLVFWTDWGKEARIERAGMDGQFRTTIIKGDRVKWPNGLALDLINKRVYWADAKLKAIYSCDYWGQDVKTVLHSHRHLRHPFSMTVFEDRVYYTDWEGDGVNSVNKFTGNDVQHVMEKVNTPMTVRIYHKQAQPLMDNKCEDSDCADLCLPRAVYRHENRKEEKDWKEHPYACVCTRDDFIDTVKCTMEIATENASHGFTLSTMLFILMLIIFASMGFIYYRKRHAENTFTALNFDNPIYRRTTEAEMDDPFRDPFSDESARDSRLVLGVSEVDSQVPTIHSSGSDAAA